MSKAAIYCRVSSEGQERDGTSLQTQLENCLTYCQNKGYDVPYRFSETYSGLSLERPELDQLREIVRAQDIDILVCYSLDRLTRDPNHGVIITQEMERYHVTLEAVTEDVDNTELGQLITYIRNYASKIEAIKIKERTSRGRKAKAKLGYITGGGFARTYGYDYVRKQFDDKGNSISGRRVINESEAAVVRQMFRWLVNDGLSSTGIANRLNSMGIPSKRGRYWSKQTVLAVLSNKSYTGRTIAFSMKRNHVKYSRPEEDWVEIPDATPAIIDESTFDAAQRQLEINRKKTVNTTIHEYLLRGHIRCRQCGRSYTGGIHSRIHNGKRYAYTRYRCMGKVRQHSPVERCHNRNWWCSKLEPMVWTEIEKYFCDPNFIRNNLEKQRHNADQTGVFETELRQIERSLKDIDREQRQLLQWALKGFPEEQVESENLRLNKDRELLKQRKAEIEKQVKTSREAVINIPKMESFIKEIQGRISDLDIDGKRLVLDALGITVWVDGTDIEITGTIAPEWGIPQTMQVYSHSQCNTLPFSLKIGTGVETQVL